MTSLLLAALALNQAPTASRYDLGERLKALESAWIPARKDAKQKALPFITQSVTAFFTANFSSASQSLDSARAALEGRSLTWADALSLRQVPSSYESADSISLQGTWAYFPSGQEVGGALRLSAEGKAESFAIGQPFTFSIPKAKTGDAADSVKVKVDGRERKVIVSITPRLTARLAPLLASMNPHAAALAELIDRQLKGLTETDISLAPVLKMAEDLEAGALDPKMARDWPIAKSGRTLLRAAFPDRLSQPETVVIALHGAGGSENLFFEGYGLGMAVNESLRRGWAFVAPRAGAAAAADSLEWLKTVRNWTPKRVIVMGHSMGGALALQTGALNQRPSAVVLFAPAGRTVPTSLQGVPLFLAVGKQEMTMLGASADSIKSQMGGSASFKHLLVDPCEHLMIVADGLPEAFKWLDQTLAE